MTSRDFCSNCFQFNFSLCPTLLPLLPYGCYSSEYLQKTTWMQFSSSGSVSWGISPQAINATTEPTKETQVTLELGHRPVGWEEGPCHWWWVDYGQPPAYCSGATVKLPQAVNWYGSRNYRRHHKGLGRTVMIRKGESDDLFHQCLWRVAEYATPKYDAGVQDMLP